MDQSQDYMVVYTDKWGVDHQGTRTTKMIARRTARMLKADGCTEVFVRKCPRPGLFLVS